MMTLEQRRVCKQVCSDYRDTMFDIPGSSTKHHVWRGGYVSHLEEAMNIAIVLYEALNARRRLHFSVGDMLFALFLHDFDKLIRYKKTKDGFAATGSYSEDYPEKTAELLQERYSYKMSTEEFNAIKYAHGEGKDYHPTDRVILPMGTLVHCADIISARIWHDKGKDRRKW